MMQREGVILVEIASLKDGSFTAVCVSAPADSCNMRIVQIHMDGYSDFTHSNQQRPDLEIFTSKQVSPLYSGTFTPS